MSIERDVVDGDSCETRTDCASARLISSLFVYDPLSPPMTSMCPSPVPLLVLSPPPLTGNPDAPPSCLPSSCVAAALSAPRSARPLTGLPPISLSSSLFVTRRPSFGPDASTILLLCSSPPYTHNPAPRQTRALESSPSLPLPLPLSLSPSLPLSFFLCRFFDGKI